MLEKEILDTVSKFSHDLPAISEAGCAVQLWLYHTYKITLAIVSVNSGVKTIFSFSRKVTVSFLQSLEK